MEESKKGHSQYFTEFALSKPSCLNIDPNPYEKYQNTTLSGSQDIVLTRFLYFYNCRVEKGA